MALGVFIFLGFIIGTATGLVLGPLVRYIQQPGTTEVYILNPLNNTIGLKRQSLQRNGGFLRINGKKAKPPLKEKYRWKRGDNPALLINARNGKPLSLDDDGDFAWPTPYECAEVYNDAREQKIHDSQNDRSADYAKIGVGVGVILTALVLVTLYMVWKLLQSSAVVPQ